MSFDPYGQPDQPPPQQPPAAGGASGAVPPPGGAPLPGAAPPPATLARERVLTPAILLIALSVLNLLATLWSLFNLTRAITTPADQLFAQVVGLYEQFEKSDNAMLRDLAAQSLKQLRESGPEGIKNQALMYSGCSSFLGVLITFLGLMGGIRMMQLRSFGLAITGSIAAAIPCLSVSGCCCGLGQAVALWCIIVLMTPEVRAAFK